MTDIEFIQAIKDGLMSSNDIKQHCKNHSCLSELAEWLSFELKHCKSNDVDVIFSEEQRPGDYNIITLEELNTVRERIAALPESMAVEVANSIPELAKDRLEAALQIACSMIEQPEPEQQYFECRNSVCDDMRKAPKDGNKINTVRFTKCLQAAIDNKWVEQIGNGYRWVFGYGDRSYRRKFAVFVAMAIRTTDDFISWKAAEMAFDNKCVKKLKNDYNNTGDSVWKDEMEAILKKALSNN